MRLNSLAFRLFASAAVWALIVLPIAAFFLVSLFRESVERSFDARLNVYLTTLIASTSVGDDGRITEPPAIGEPVFTFPFSGWYWQIKRLQGGGGVVASSESLAERVLVSLSDIGVAADEKFVREAYFDGPKSRRLKGIEREITFGDGPQSQRYSFFVTGNAAEIDNDVSDFTAAVVSTLALLGLGLVLATLFQVRYGLAPLGAIGDGLAAIRSGKAAKLEGRFPAEIEPLQKELNALLRSNRDVIDRARTHVGNLAHALKTPLSVIRNEAKGDNSLLGQKVLEQTALMKDQVTHHLDRARMAARVNLVASVTPVLPVVQALTRALERIYKEKGLVIDVDCPDIVKFRGERQDLEEMIGNLLDNSCKWARSKVCVTVMPISDLNGSADLSFTILIEDDGPGLSKDERKLVVKRGKRLDETTPGSGLGLSIVADLSHLYKGEFHLEKSQLGGLGARLRLPAVRSDRRS